MMMTRRSLLLLAVALWVGGGLFVAVSPAPAQALCPEETYVVQPGDTLYSIARHHQTTVAQLMELNAGRIFNPHWIYIGQSICLPANSSTIPTLGAVTLEIVYTYIPTQGEDEWSLVGGDTMQLGRQVSYPLVGLDAIRAFATPRELYNAVRTNTTMPLLLGVPLLSATPMYGIVEIGGQAEVLAHLTFTESTFIDTLFPTDCTSQPPAALDPAAQEATMTLWLESADGRRFPLLINDVNFIREQANIWTCYAQPAFTFALFPAGAERYTLWIVLTQTGLGPPGTALATQCRTWARFNSAYYRWLRMIYGCPFR